LIVIPANAGIQFLDRFMKNWIPAFAGMTSKSPGWDDEQAFTGMTSKSGKNWIQPSLG